MEDFLAQKKVALVHDYLVQDGGAERVLACLQEMFPSAPTYVLLHDRKHTHPPFAGSEIRTSFLHRFPWVTRLYQWYLPFMPLAMEHLDFSGFDLVISSSIYFSKGIIVPPETAHICYCHSPTRFLWRERLTYLNDLPQPKFIRTLIQPFLHSLRTWDRLAAERPDHLLTNSLMSQAGIQRYYQRTSTVIHPPVDVERIPLSTTPGSFWLAGGRLVGYKRFDLIVRAFAELNLPLKIFGSGPEAARLKRLAGKHVQFLGYVNEDTKIQLYQQAIGFLHPQNEDFGITAVEAMGAGKPIIAYYKGGAAETVVPGVTGEYLEHQQVGDIVTAIKTFNPEKYDPATIRAHAMQFSKERFKEKLRAFLSQHLTNA